MLRYFNLTKHNKFFLYSILLNFRIKFIFIHKFFKQQLHILSNFKKINTKLLILLASSFEDLIFLFKYINARLLRNIILSSAIPLFFRINFNIVDLQFYKNLNFYEDITDFIEEFYEIIYYLYIFNLQLKKNILLLNLNFYSNIYIFIKFSFFKNVYYSSSGI